MGERIDNSQYVVQALPSGFVANNHAQGFKADFDAQGARLLPVGSGQEPVFIGGVALGTEHERVALPIADLRLEGCVEPRLLDAEGKCVPRLAAVRPLVTEYWDNSPRGLEHSFVIDGAPSADAPRVFVEVQITGAKVEIASSGTDAVLTQPETGLRLNYTGLAAWDRTGRRLPAQLLPSDHGVTLEVNTQGAVYPVTVDPLLSNAAWSAESNQARAYFGDSVGNAGDVNNDGFEDVLVGAPYFDTPTADAGRAYLYLGSAAGLSLTAAWTASGDIQGSTFGDTVVGAGDVNADGYDDVLVAAPRRDNAPGQGGVHLYAGGPAGLSSSPVWTIQSILIAELFGYSAAPAGDVNGDGFADVIVGARAYYNGEANEGRAFVFLGSASGLPSSPDWQVESNQVGALMGHSVAGAGDVNADGFDDVIVGVRNYDNGQDNEGRALVYLGGSSGLSTTAVWSVESNQLGALFGSVVIGAGDVNADGYDDIAVGAPNYDLGEANEGAVFLYLGSPGGPSPTPAWTGQGDQADAHYGSSLAAGKIGLDDRSDLIVGMPDFDQGAADYGRAFVYTGTTGGLDTSPAWTQTGADTDDQLGASVASADVNGDGMDDVIVGAWTHDVGQDDEGGAFGYEAVLPVPIFGKPGWVALLGALLGALGALTFRRGVR